MSNASSSSRISSGPFPVYALSLLEDLDAEEKIILGKSRTCTLIFQGVIPVVLLARKADADWVFEMLESFLEGIA